MRRALFSIFCCSVFLGFIAGPVSAAASKDIGEAFGRPISADEFEYYYKTASIFTRSGKQNRTEEDTRSEAWQNLIFTREARDLKIDITDDELKSELRRLMSEKNVEYGGNEYYLWVLAQFNEKADVFERRIRDLLVINKFKKIKTEPEISVTEEEMKEKFLNQYNSFESEYILFETGEEAKNFAEEAKKNPRLWKDTYDEKKPLGQKGASWINVMSLEALIDLWQIPKEDAYNIHSHEPGDFIVSRFYYGTAVFRLLYKKEADIGEYNDKKKEYYKNTMTQSRRYKIVQDYFNDLFKRAGYKDFVAEEMKLKKIEDLKKRSNVVLRTNQGDIKLKLFPDIAPKACENFIGLIEKGYYNGLVFHRVIKDFMIQGGDPTGTGAGGESLWGEAFHDEVSDKVLFDKPGLLAMANSGPDTNKSQFFITTKAAAWLNKKHTIFGEVVDGYEVVQKIESAPTDSGDRPKENQKITKAYIE